MTKSEMQLLDLLKRADLPERGSYRRIEVCRILSISKRTFWSMVSRYEIDPDTGRPRDPSSLDSFMMRRERRVTFKELVNFLRRNNSYARSYTI